MADFNERRAKIDTVAIHGNPQFGKDQLAALTAHTLVDIAEALTAIYGVLSEGVEPSTGGPGTAPIDPVSGEPALAEDVGDDESEEPVEVGDWVVPLNDELPIPREVIAVGGSEGKPWLIYGYSDDEGDPHESGKLWADQFTRVDPPRPPAPPETEATNPADGPEQRRKAAEAHMANINTEPKVEYESASYDAPGMSGKDFDVPLGIPGAPVKVKSKGGK